MCWFISRGSATPTQKINYDAGLVIFCTAPKDRLICKMLGPEGRGGGGDLVEPRSPKDLPHCFDLFDAWRLFAKSLVPSFMV